MFEKLAKIKSITADIEAIEVSIDIMAALNAEVLEKNNMKTVLPQTFMGITIRLAHPDKGYNYLNISYRGGNK